MSDMVKAPRQEHLLLNPKKKRPTKEEIERQYNQPVRSIIQLCESMFELYELGRYTLEECCKARGIHMQNFKKWVRPDLDVKNMMVMGEPLPDGVIADLNISYQESNAIADVTYRETIREDARSALSKKVKGFISKEISETHIIDTDMEVMDPETGEMLPNPNFGKIKMTARRIKMKREAPDTTAIMFALTNVDKENFKNRNNVQSDIEIKNSNLQGLSEAELEAKIKELDEKIAAYGA